MLDLQIAKMSATTPSGGFSSLVFPKNKMIRMEGDKFIAPENTFSMSRDIEKMSISDIEILKKLKIFDEDDAICKVTLGLIICNSQFDIF